MAAAYASIITLNYQVIEQILHHNRSKPSYSVKQLKKVESFKEITIFLQEFLEKYSNNIELMEMLESRIRTIADKAQDILESYRVNYVLCPNVEQNLSSHEKSFQCLDKVIENMNSIKEEVIKIKDQVQPGDLVSPDVSAGENNSPAPEDDGQLEKSIKELDGQLGRILEKLAGGESRELLTISLTGMAGIGKTTLAKKVCDVYKRDNFVCACVTISQVNTVEALLLELVKLLTNKNNPREYNRDELGLELYQYLSGRRFLIVMDDVWETDIWDELKLFIPNNKNGSRILVTTRLVKVAKYINLDGLHEMDFLDEDQSWNLLCRKAFGQEGCPKPEFEEILKNISKNCKGHPLSIVVVAELFTRSKIITKELLELVVNDTNRTINSENNDYAFKLLSLSYNRLPIHLKPCLLYMGSYLEDHKIHISTLINLWVAEGFLKPNKSKTLEVVGEEYLKDLIESNLVMVDHELGTTGEMRKCYIHGLVRDLCLQESHRGEFLCFTKMNKDKVPSNVFGQQHRRIVLQDFKSNDLDDYLESIPHTRSLSYRNHPHVITSKLVSDNLKFLKVFSMYDPSTSHLYDEGDVQNFSSMELYNLRYIDTYLNRGIVSLNRIRSLQTVCIKEYSHTQEGVLDIWKMLELRHLKSSEIYLSNPSLDCQEEESVLENLQTLTEIVDFELTEEVLKRIRNVKKLGLHYRNIHKNLSFDISSCLHELESLKVRFSGASRSIGNIYTFPPTLKRLHLDDCCSLDDVIVNIGELLNLEKLTLEGLAGDKWDSGEEQFKSLKYLCIRGFSEENFVWTAESDHFPALETLVIGKMSLEIPSGFAESTTLLSIYLESCQGSKTIESAIKIYEEHKSFNEKGILVTEKYESHGEMKVKVYQDHD